MLKKFIISILLFSLICCFCGCKEEVDYYEIEMIDVDDDYLFQLYDNKNLYLVENDNSDFYVSNIISMKNLLGYDEEMAESNMRNYIISDINLTRYNYGLDMSEYTVKNIVTNEKFTIKDLLQNKPTLFIKMTYTCDSCDKFDCRMLNDIDLTKYNYYYLVDSDEYEEEVEYLKGKGANTSRIYAIDAILDGNAFFDDLGTPGTFYLSSDGILRIAMQYVLLNDGKFFGEVLSTIEDQYFPILTNEELKNMGIITDY